MFETAVREQGIVILTAAEQLALENELKLTSTGADIVEATPSNLVSSAE